METGNIDEKVRKMEEDITHLGNRIRELEDDKSYRKGIRTGIIWCIPIILALFVLLVKIIIFP